MYRVEDEDVEKSLEGDPERTGHTYLMQRKKCDEAIDVIECVMCSCHCEDAVDEGVCYPH